jgi:hypothetical protein
MYKVIRIGTIKVKRLMGSLLMLDIFLTKRII